MKMCSICHEMRHSPCAVEEAREVTQMEVNLAMPTMADVLTSLLGERSVSNDSRTFAIDASDCEEYEYDGTNDWNERDDYERERY